MLHRAIERHLGTFVSCHSDEERKSIKVPSKSFYSNTRNSSMIQISKRKLIILLTGGSIYCFSMNRWNSHLCFVESFVIAPTNGRYFLTEPTVAQPKSIYLHSSHQKGFSLKVSLKDDSDQEDGDEATGAENTVQYDDFGDFVLGGVIESQPIEFNELLTVGESDNTSTNLDLKQLSGLVSKSFQQEVARDNRIAQNWRKGNWKVRGFSLDKYMYDPTALTPKQDQINSTATNRKKEDRNMNTPPIFITKVVMERSSTLEEEEEENRYEKDVIAVGRTDGSIILVQLGTEILTKFVGLDSTSEMDSTTAMKREFQRETSSSVIENNPEILRRNATIPKDPTNKPFQILASVQAHPVHDSISAILLLDDTLYTAGGNSGMIKIWKLVDEDKEETDSLTSANPCKIIPLHMLSDAHSEKIVALIPLSSRLIPSNSETGDYNILLSASVDGSFALWDLNTCNLLTLNNVRKIHDDEDPTLSINCVDVFENMVALGLSNGQVMVLDSDSWLEANRKEGPHPKPLCCFPSTATKPTLKAPSVDDSQPCGITAISFVGRGSLQSLDMPTSSSYTVITGSSSGTIKQWELLTRTLPSSPDGTMGSRKMEYWPRLSTQRLKKRAHVFKSSHLGPVSALTATSSRVISAGKDGSVIVSSPSTGEELYRMDGFTKDISSLCLDRDILITDGMEEYVAFHDFDVTEEEIEANYEM